MFDNRDLEWIFNGAESNGVKRYPLTDFYVNPETEDVIIKVAIAGFDSNDIDLELVGDELTITGKYSDDEEDAGLEELQKPFISNQDFERKVKLNKIYRDGNVTAKIVKGILRITVEKTEMPRKLIEIG